MVIRDTRDQSPLILFLALLSGACGLAWEILYIRLFSNYFGDSFIISGITLSAVFLGISFGAWNSLRFRRKLGLIELALGTWGAISAIMFSFFGFPIVASLSSVLMQSIALATLLGVPAFLIGTCIPLFSDLASSLKSSKESRFTTVYALYNIGAFLSVLIIEFFLFRTFGLLITCLTISLINLTIAASLYILGQERYTLSTQTNHTVLHKKPILSLFLCSFASGVFQLFVLNLSYSVFGPLHENFAIVLTSAILGISAGTWVRSRYSLNLPEIAKLLTLSLLTFLIFVPAFIEIRAFLSEQATNDTVALLFKAGLLGGFTLPVFTLFGMLVPAAVSDHPNGTSQLAGQYLAISGFANGLGSLAMFLLLYKYLDHLTIGIILAGITLVAWIICSPKRPGFSQIVTGFMAGSAMLFAAVQLWPHIQLLLGYRTLLHAGEIEYRLQTYEGAHIYKDYDQNAALVYFSDASSLLVLNGYKSLSFGPGSRSELHEVIVGATPTLFQGQHRSALVFGLGSGITGGATARLHDETKIVEINPAMLNMPQHFVNQNANVMNRPSVQVALEDGISTLISNEQSYDTIINTVTSPQYYSAAKLYTRDFYSIVKSRLAENGIYSSWFDVNIDREGIAIMLNTLEGSFENCRYFLMTTGYFNVVCSDGPLIYASTRDVERQTGDTNIDALFTRYGFNDGFRETMLAVEMDFSGPHFTRTTDEVNTLDHPAIEFVVARERDASNTIDLLGDMVVSNIEAQRRRSLGTSDWRSNCNIIAKMSYLEFSGC